MLVPYFSVFYNKDPRVTACILVVEYGADFYFLPPSQGHWKFSLPVWSHGDGNFFESQAMTPVAPLSTLSSVS